MGRMFGSMVPGLDMKPLLAELRLALPRNSTTYARASPSGSSLLLTKATPTSSSPHFGCQPEAADFRMGRGHPVVKGHQRRNAGGT